MSMRNINFTLNGQAVTADIEPHRNLVELLQRFDLFGARESCGQGLCGCCTVLVDDVAVSGCLYFAVWADGKSITKDCQTCHSVLSQEEGGVSMAAVQKVTFQHPIDLGDMTQVNCSDCHASGGTQ